MMMMMVDGTMLKEAVWHDHSVQLVFGSRVAELVAVTTEVENALFDRIKNSF